jgi:hypothetical protein
MGPRPPRRRDTETRIRLFNERKVLLHQAADRVGGELSTRLCLIPLSEANSLLRREK